MLWREPIRGRQFRRFLLVLTAALVAALAVSACGGGEDDSGGSSKPKGEIVITCGACQLEKTSPFMQYYNAATERFNRTFAGRYRIEIAKNRYVLADGDQRLQYYQRLALANDLPDVFLVSPIEVSKLYRTGKLVDWTPVLDKDSEWANSFYDGAFSTVDDDAGHRWAVPGNRDALGVYYNRRIFADAGVSEFPQTWDDLAVACRKIEATGKSCLAMDGDWTTLLMWANLIGTQPDNNDFLVTGIARGDYASNPAVVRATETLKQWHTEGFTNKDAFSGDYTNAGNAFLHGEAAMIANGPWMVPYDIRGRDAMRGLYEETGYEPSPGWTADGRGLIILAGGGAWASSDVKDADKLEAVAAFVKFMGTHDETFAQLQLTASYPATKLELTDAEKAKVDPLSAGLVEQSATLPTYPHAYSSAPSGFQGAWKNLWPAYVKGQMDTQQFLQRLGDDATSATG